jgi:NADH-quinone oxidoreductase subunit L
VVNGSWKVVGWVAGAVRRLQSGYLYHYALVMILGIFVLMTYFVWLNK